MNSGVAIGLIVFGLPLLAVLIGTAIGSHFGTGTDNDFDVHP